MICRVERALACVATIRLSPSLARCACRCAASDVLPRRPWWPMWLYGLRRVGSGTKPAAAMSAGV